MIGGLLLLYFVGRAFFRLAGEYDKTEWGFAILGIISYYAGLFIGGMILGVVIEVFSPGSLDTMSDFVLGLMALPLGVLACWGFYKILENSWSKQRTRSQPDTLDGGMIDDSNQFSNR